MQEDQMINFPDFMKAGANKVPAAKQNTSDIEGYYYTANDGSQMAFWTCYSDRESKMHQHDFDEYVVCVCGQYTACFSEGREVVLHPGDELFIPAGTEQWENASPERGRSTLSGGKEYHWGNCNGTQESDTSGYRSACAQQACVHKLNA
jgi:quercetin dioxygenase-like cupin family protein